MWHDYSDSEFDKHLDGAKNFGLPGMQMEHPTDKSKVLGNKDSALPLSPYEGWKGKTLSPVEFAKVTDILAACNFSEKTHLLTTLATSEAGLVDDEVRRVACGSTIGHETTEG